MKRLLGLGVALVAAALLWSGSLTSSGSVHADPFNAVFQYYATYTTTANASNPDQTININIDCPAGVCPATSLAPFFDIAVTHYASSNHNCASPDATAGCSGTEPVVGALLGNSSFQLNTNIVAADLPENVNAVTGLAAGCGDAGTTTLSSSFDIINGANTVTDLVSGKDGADLDTLPDTQADTDADGIPDGAEKLPDYLQLLLGNSTINNLVGGISGGGRGYGIAVIVAGSAQTDVNFVTLDLNVLVPALGYASVTTLGDVRPSNVADPNAGQATETCAPFKSEVTTLGVSANNPASVAVEPSQPVRALTGGAGTALYYAIDVSGGEDVDGDGTPLTSDTCDNPDVGLFPVSGLTSASGLADGDGDGLGDSCDTDPGTKNNCPGVAHVAKSAACNAAGADPLVWPIQQSGCTLTPGPVLTYTIACTTPWNPDQDVDGDQHLNLSDNCPTTFNPTQADVNGDAIGDDCQTKRLTTAGNRPERPAHDHDDFCSTATTIGGTTTPATTCFAATAHDVGGGILTGVPTAGLAQDSNDDGFPDFLTIPGFALTDKNSDSDSDGCSDFAETSGGAVATGACGPSGGAKNPKVANSSGANDCISWLPGGVDVTRCVDGGKDDPNGIVDWRDIAADPAQGDATTNPNAGMPDSDGDGCTNRREVLATNAVGGNRDALNKWDFFDAERTVSGVLIRDKVIAIADVTGGLLPYIGTSQATPNTPNVNGRTYAGDDGLDGIKNFEWMDRGPGIGGMTGPPSGAVNISDAILMVGQIGANCSTG